MCVSHQLKNGNFLLCEACVNNCISDSQSKLEPLGLLYQTGVEVT